MLGDPNKGDVFVQFAQIQAKKNGQVTLVLSNEHGSMNEKVQTIPSDLFVRNFRRARDREKTFVKRVKVEDLINKQTQVKFSIVDEKGEIIQTNLTISKRLFLQTYHICLETSF